jgi:hypothetical protein
MGQVTPCGRREAYLVLLRCASTVVRMLKFTYRTWLSAPRTTTANRVLLGP